MESVNERWVNGSATGRECLATYGRRHMFKPNWQKKSKRIENILLSTLVSWNWFLTKKSNFICDLNTEVLLADGSRMILIRSLLMQVTLLPSYLTKMQNVIPLQDSGSCILWFMCYLGRGFKYLFYWELLFSC